MIKEFGRNNQRISKEHITFVLWNFSGTDKNVRRIKENVDSRNVIPRLTLHKIQILKQSVSEQTIRKK
jgi:hypothetical protein